MTIRRLLAVAALLAPILNASVAAEDEPVTFSEAETRLWMTDQLKSVSDAMALTYRFERSGSLDQGFSDEVHFTIERVNDDGTKSASVQFFSGERTFPVPPVESTTVNPVIKIYLQGDVYEMNRLTDPQGTSRERWRYFQRRIKFALAESAEVKPTTFTFDGREWSGHEIRFRPYANDPRRNLFEQYADKEYVVVVSDDLPGYLYRIETVVPVSGSATALVREVLELERVEPVAR